eukprot:s1658_g14.t1
MQAEDIKLKMSAAESHWQLGRVESHGKVVKRMLDLMNSESPIRGEDGFGRALWQVFTAKNSLSRVHGFTPEQAVLGVARRLPASVTSSSEVSSHSLAESDTSEGSAFKEAIRLRSSARKAFVEADNCSSLRRALLRRSRPLRDQYEVGDWVLYWKKKGGNLRREHGRWMGPARVALVEGLKVIWLTHANKLIRASPEQLRPASLREWKAVRTSEEATIPVKQWLDRAQHQDYFDLGESVPSAEDVVVGDLQGEADSIPEPESAPSVMSGDLPSAPEETTAVNPSGPPEIPVGGLHIPVPNSDEETHELMFGDTVEGDVGFGNCVWEIDITPENVDSSGYGEQDIFLSSHVSADEWALLMSEQRKKRVEVRLKDLGEREQQLFASAKHKEIKAWLHHGTVRKVAKGKIPDHALMRCRWILNWKDATGEETAADLSNHGKRAKARLVIIGYEDPGIDVVTNDAPTLTKDGRGSVLQAISSHRWELLSFDVSTAFLHGRGDGRNLGIHPPSELKEALGMGPSDLCALDKGAYGRIDAPFLWFCEFRDELIRQGCTQCPLDPCVFGLYSKLEYDSHGRALPQKFHGCLGIHVDDGIAGGDQEFLAMLKRIESRFKFGSFEKREFKYTGIHFRQWDDFSIEYDQIEYIERISPVIIEKSRRLQPGSPLTETERSSLRSIVGALQYAAVHSRPDIAAKVGELQSAVNRATVAELIQANRVLAEAKQHKVSLMVLPIKPEALTFCAFSDASFLSGKQSCAHQGTLIFATTPELLDNKRAVVAPVAWTSKKVPRVAGRCKATAEITLLGVRHSFAGSPAQHASEAKEDTAKRVLWYLQCPGYENLFEPDVQGVAAVAKEIPTPPSNWVNLSEDDESVQAAERKTAVMRLQNRLQQSFAKKLKPGQGVWEWSYETDASDENWPPLQRATVCVPVAHQSFTGPWKRGQREAQLEACQMLQGFLDSLERPELKSCVQAVFFFSPKPARSYRCLLSERHAGLADEYLSGSFVPKVRLGRCNECAYDLGP